MSTILIGIAGGTGSGKTTLTRHLKEHFGPEVTVIGHDNYYKRQDGKTLEERAKVNYDHPAAFDTELLIEHLKELKEGRPIRCPVYSYVEHNRTEETREILPTKVIIVEGILIFLWGDRIFEKCGIRRDEGGDGGKTLEIRGKRRLSARDGGANYQQS